MQAIAELRNAAKCLINGLNARMKKIQDTKLSHVGRIIEVCGAGSKNQICKLGPEFSFRLKLIEAFRASEQAT
jgi:hypothetical protein